MPASARSSHERALSEHQKIYLAPPSLLAQQVLWIDEYETRNRRHKSTPNRIETKRNETKRNETNRIETKRNDDMLFSVSARDAPESADFLARSAPSVAGPRVSKSVCVALDSRNRNAFPPSSNSSNMYSAVADAEIVLPEPVSGVVDMEFAGLRFPCDRVPNVHPAFGNAHLLFVNGVTGEQQVVRVPAGRYAGLAELLAALNDAMHLAAADTSTPWIFPFQDWIFHAREDDPECGGGATRVFFNHQSGGAPPEGNPAPAPAPGTKYHWSSWMVATNACFGGLAHTLGFVPVGRALGDHDVTMLRSFPLTLLGTKFALPAPANVSGGDSLRLLPSPFSSLVVHVRDTHEFGGDSAAAGGGNRVLLTPEPAQSIARNHFGAADAGVGGGGTNHVLALCSVFGSENSTFFSDSLGNVACTARKHYPHANASAQYNAHLVSRLRVTVTNELLQPVPLPANAHFTLTLRLTTYGT